MMNDRSSYVRAVLGCSYSQQVTVSVVFGLIDVNSHGRGQRGESAMHWRVHNLQTCRLYLNLDELFLRNMMASSAHPPPKKQNNASHIFRQVYLFYSP